jgi:hypothetical protein
MRVLIILIFTVAWSLAPNAGRASTECADMLFGPADLENILDVAVGSWRSIVRERSVVIDPTHAQCYIRIRMVADPLPGMECTLEACSVALFHGQQIGLREFDIHGCDTAFDLLPVSRHVPTALTDAREQIQQHCKSTRFVITQVSPVSYKNGAGLRVQLRPAP